MRGSLFLAFFLVASGLNARQIDYARSSITFEATSRLMSVRGSFSEWTFKGALDPEVRGVLEVKTASISTSNGMRDNHLRSADFFNCEETPLALFKIQKAEQTPDGITLDGILSIRNIEKPIQLRLTRTGNNWGGSFVIRRQDYGMNYASTLNPIGDNVRVTVSLALLP
ncbi:MAG: YceI family protein [Leptospirales bacterium]|nr:YceI family protein [Leptospirales bacterium]